MVCIKYTSYNTVKQVGMQQIIYIHRKLVSTFMLERLVKYKLIVFFVVGMRQVRSEEVVHWVH